MSLLSVRGVSKRFDTVQALDAVNLDFRAGEIHAILGENGAGKSTLMHILDGVYRPDAGTIVLDGARVTFASPREARRAGIGMVHQHFTLIDTLTVAENLALSVPHASGWRLDTVAIAHAARTVADEIGLEIAPPQTRVSDLPVGARQRLEILKALAGAGRVLILDEPTAVLTPQEVRQFFDMLRRLRAQNRLVIFITHKLREVKDLADRVSILRRGRVIGTDAVRAVSEAVLAEQMVGHGEPAPTRPARSAPVASIALRVERLSFRDRAGVAALVDVTFEVWRGEIFGIAGVDGNGQRELFDVLTGLARPTSGRVEVAGRPLTTFAPRAALAAGIGHIPPDRQREGLVLAMTVEENLLLHRGILNRFNRHGLLARDEARHFAQQLVTQYHVKISSLDTPVSALSGGNQQRVVVARELAQQPIVLVTANPTRGLDLIAARSVADALRGLAANGCAVVLISTDLDEVTDLCDRVSVLFRGRLSAALPAPIDLEPLGLLMAGAGNEMDGVEPRFAEPPR